MSVGKLSPAQLTDFGRYYKRTVGYISLGPFALFVTMPHRWDKPDAPGSGDEAPASGINMKWFT